MTTTLHRLKLTWDGGMSFADCKEAPIRVSQAHGDQQWVVLVRGEHAHWTPWGESPRFADYTQATEYVESNLQAILLTIDTSSVDQRVLLRADLYATVRDLGDQVDAEREEGRNAPVLLAARATALAALAQMES